jgi:hypothetical protein
MTVTRHGFVPRLAIALLACGACHPTPKTADQVLDRAIAAHGGAALTTWKTLSVRGRIRMQDGIAYKAGYLLLARWPDKLRVEHDATKDRGRRFDEYFLDGTVAWSRANLVVGTANAKQLRRWFLQALGPAQGRHGTLTGLTLRPDAVVPWLEEDGDGWRETDPRPADVIAFSRDGEAYELYFDKKTFQLLQESWPGGRRLYRDFRRFGAVTWPTRVLEITRGRQSDVVTPITFESVTYDGALEDWLFTEDRPRG